MYCADCGKHISQEEFLENGELCYDCFEDVILEAMEDEDNNSD